MLRIIRNFIYLCFALGVVGIVALYVYAQELAEKYDLADTQLGGTLWSSPARVYARPLELYQGASVDLPTLERELGLLNYKKVENPVSEHQYSKHNQSIIYYAPAFAFWDGIQSARKVEVQFSGGKVSQIFNQTTLEPLVFERLEPLRISTIYPLKKGGKPASGEAQADVEDRLLVSLAQVPPILLDTLLYNEDRNFYEHKGIDVRGLARAIYTTYIAKTGVQGGSTLTQQFIKNHYLSAEQTIGRKIEEILMSLMLERHATKAQILEAYINEIPLGQDGSRAIHGFGSASEYYFNKKLSELGLHEIALLLALVREPGGSDPHRSQERALQRRNLMLENMYVAGLIAENEKDLAQNLPLDVVARESTRERNRYPAFISLAYQQLYQNYNQSDLTREGLNIFTTIDPQIQEAVQDALSKALVQLEKNNRMKKEYLQAAAVLTDSQTGEIKALVGSRIAGDTGFNRATQIKRQIGSLVKPVIYLAALEYPQLYTLATLIDDSPITYNKWKPQNYNKRNHGQVTLEDALVRSLNIPTVRIALNLGIREEVLPILRRLGARENLPAYPSISLGALDMSPVEVAQIYQTFANGGYYKPLSTIREITSKDGRLIDSFSMPTTKAIEATPHFLIVSAMQEIPRRGTAAAMKEKLSPSLNIAGKTGTTDNYRDSWFAGFSGNYSAVVWVGNDQNQPVGLTGGKGAMWVWVDIMNQLKQVPLNLRQPEGIVTKFINPQTGLLAGSGCRGAQARPTYFIEGSQPYRSSPCYVEPEVFYGESDIGAWQAAPAAHAIGRAGENPSENASKQSDSKAPASWFER